MFGKEARSFMATLYPENSITSQLEKVREFSGNQEGLKTKKKARNKTRNCTFYYFFIMQYRVCKACTLVLFVSQPYASLSLLFHSVFFFSGTKFVLEYVGIIPYVLVTMWIWQVQKGLACIVVGGELFFQPSFSLIQGKVKEKLFFIINRV